MNIFIKTNKYARVILILHVSCVKYEIKHIYVGYVNICAQNNKIQHGYVCYADTYV